MEELPGYLFHYTSIETLSLILKNKSIRFTTLNHVDDETEGKTKDMLDIGQWFLVSCWTSDENESIPLWHLYSKNMKGIRIKMPLFPFEDPDYQNNDNNSFFNKPMTEDGKLLDFILFYPKNKLVKINYVNELRDINLFEIINAEEIEKTKKLGFHVNYNEKEIGLFKLKEWEFQKEWRYRINLAPREIANENIKVSSIEDALGYFKPIDLLHNSKKVSAQDLRP